MRENLELNGRITGTEYVIDGGTVPTAWRSKLISRSTPSKGRATLQSIQEQNEIADT